MNTNDKYKKPLHKAIGFAIILILWPILEYYWFLYLNDGTLPKRDMWMLAIQVIIFIAYYLYWLFRMPKPQTAWELLEETVKEIQEKEDELINQGVIEQYEKFNSGELIDLYKKLDSESMSRNVQADQEKTLDLSCRKIFIAKILESRNVAAWTYGSGRKETKDELIDQLAQFMDKHDRSN